jgi:hypothetical protein
MSHIDDGTIRLLKIANKKLKQPHLHFNHVSSSFPFTILRKAGVTSAIFFALEK